eukprot:gnl/TRDRNA2_/TRDRNA2_42352_c0_seq1.p1 gnl/TRDRNA2_/TRDRNA2_42352_c0~~gnl/TRDRNA2_/TRDRNA2_42352_c0_seq1.p1  ORF type:complete len:401 (+),score=48.91 gnl/TRDRNA2_/TRDRNA2_42352_c0_seq1:145-1347(+)
MYGAVDADGGAVLRNEPAAWEAVAAPWALFWESAGCLLREGIVLGIMFWYLHQSPPHGLGCPTGKLPWFCSTTRAFFDGFPLLAAVVCVCVAQRQVLRKRAYYGLLKRRIIIDFREIEEQCEVMFVVLACCLFIAMLNEVVFYTTYVKFDPKSGETTVSIRNVLKAALEKNGEIDWDVDEEASKFLLAYCVPCIVSLIFIVMANRIEDSTLALNTYFVGDPESAKRDLRDAIVVSEFEVAACLHPDIALDANTAPEENVQETYAALMRRLHIPGPTDRPTQLDVRTRCCQWPTFRTYQHGLLSIPWPAALLLRPAPEDEDSYAFQKMWWVFSMVSTVLLSVVVCVLGQLSWKMWYAALSPDSHIGLHTAAIVLTLHVLVAARALHVTILCLPIPWPCWRL